MEGGDKFYAMARRGGVDYIVITLLYKNGYVDYSLDGGELTPPCRSPSPRNSWTSWSRLGAPASGSGIGGSS